MLVAAMGAAGVALRSTGAEKARHDWREYGGHQGTRYSTLTQINRANVRRLQVAWRYDTGETGGLQTQPLMVDGLVYANTPGHRVIALDATTGALAWRFDAGIASRGPNRGVTYWSTGSEARVFASVSTFLYALDARTGEVEKGFGDGGRIDLRRGLGRDDEPLTVTLTSPGVVYRDLLIIGSVTGERLPAPPGDIRAYDVRTGAIRWTFRTIPAPGEIGADTWPANARTESGSANNWAGLTLDADRGIVYVPTGSAAFDFYGGDRHGDNLFANCIIALEAATGKRIWHFQTVRHDLWDKDLTAPPTLITFFARGVTCPAWLRRPSRARSSSSTASRASRCSRSSTARSRARTYPANEPPTRSRFRSCRGRSCRRRPPRPCSPGGRRKRTGGRLEAFRGMRTGEFMPVAVGRNTLISPGMDGGVEWGGAAFDPATRRLFVNVSNLPQFTSLVENTPAAADANGRELYRVHCAACHGDDLRGQPPQVPSLVGLASRRSLEEIDAVIKNGAGPMGGFRARSGRRRWKAWCSTSPRAP